MTKGMKIVEFRAENFKRLKLVEFKPDGVLQVIRGENAQGKTSIMDAVFAALEWAAASKQISKVIREGEDHAEVKLVFDDIIVTRTWTEGEKSVLKVTSALGAEFKSPQTMLDGLLGRLSFDPLEFTRLDAKSQVKALMDIAGLGSTLDELETKRAGFYSARTDVGRVMEIHKAAVAKLGDVEVEAAPVVVADLMAEGQRLGENNRLRVERERRIDELTAAILAMSEELNSIAELLKSQEPLTDLTYINNQIANAEEINGAIKRNVERKEVGNLYLTAKTSYDGFTASIDAVDLEKKTILENAKFPLRELSFNGEVVTYKDIPFSDCSSSEQIKVSLIMAMALNPTIKVIRILDGSLLDNSSMALIAEMAEEYGFQVWIERVGDADGIGIILEDGEVKE